MLEADRKGEWAWIDTIKRRSSKEGAAGEKVTRLKDAMLSLAKDNDHGVRMHVAHAITTLFYSDESHDSHVILLPQKEQQKVYDKIFAMLQEAYKVKVWSHCSISIFIPSLPPSPRPHKTS